jgi:nucleoid-associated protein YgaU
VPVVRAPAPTAPSAPAETPPASLPLRADAPVVAGDAPARVRASVATSHRTYVVRAGDNLWAIARAEVTRTTGTNAVDDAAVAQYWQHLVAANRATLRSGDPSLIFPGEVVTLPLD